MVFTLFLVAACANSPSRRACWICPGKTVPNGGWGAVPLPCAGRLMGCAQKCTSHFSRFSEKVCKRRQSSVGKTCRCLTASDQCLGDFWSRERANLPRGRPFLADFRPVRHEVTVFIISFCPKIVKEDRAFSALLPSAQAMRGRVRRCTSRLQTAQKIYIPDDIREIFLSCAACRSSERHPGEERRSLPKRLLLSARPRLRCGRFTSPLQNLPGNDHLSVAPLPEVFRGAGGFFQKAPLPGFGAAPREKTTYLTD